MYLPPCFGEGLAILMGYLDTCRVRFVFEVMRRVPRIPLITSKVRGVLDMWYLRTMSIRCWYGDVLMDRDLWFSDLRRWKVIEKFK